MKAALLLAVALYSSNAFAQEVAPMPCVNSANTIERNRCFAAEVESLEMLLRIEVKRVEYVLRAQDKEDPMLQLAQAFNASQAKWQAFREAECTFRSRTYGSGTGAPSEGMWCQVEHGRTRLEHLRSIR
jgi:uncharacterized protein YecT (DUF1311 family)